MRTAEEGKREGGNMVRASLGPPDCDGDCDGDCGTVLYLLKAKLTSDAWTDERLSTKLTLSGSAVNCTVLTLSLLPPSLPKPKNPLS